MRNMKNRLCVCENKRETECVFARMRVRVQTKFEKINSQNLEVDPAIEILQKLGHPKQVKRYSKVYCNSERRKIAEKKSNFSNSS